MGLIGRTEASAVHVAGEWRLTNHVAADRPANQPTDDEATDESANKPARQTNGDRSAVWVCSPPGTSHFRASCDAEQPTDLGAGHFGANRFGVRDSQLHRRGHLPPLERNSLPTVPDQLPHRIAHTGRLHFGPRHDLR